MVKSVTQLTIKNDSTIKSSLDLLKSLAKCKNFDKLEILDLTCYRSNSKDVQYLAECYMPKLNELLLYQSVTNYNDTLEVLNGKFMSSIKKLDVSNYYSNSLENGDESISESKYSSQLTYLKIVNNSPNYLKRVDLLLKDKVNLEHLNMEYYQLSLYPNLLTIGNYLKLTYLSISYCLIGNYEFVNLVLSNNLPNLTTLKASNLNCITWGQLVDTTVVEFPSNSQTSLTELDLFEAKLDCFPTIIDHCPKLKRLTISSGRAYNILFSKMLESPNLANLEYLNIECCSETLKIIFTTRIYSNLKELVINSIDEEEFEPCLISDCTNLVNLKTMTIRNIMTGISRRKIKENPIFSNITIINNHLRYWECESEEEEG